MRFTSRKDTLFTVIILGTCLLLLTITVLGILKGEMSKNEYFVIPIVLVSIAFLLWVFYGTNYELTDDALIYRSGPIRGKISVNRITEIVKSKTAWSGLKPATARNGLIIKYDTYNEIYISPYTNKTFIEKIVLLNNRIKITH